MNGEQRQRITFTVELDVPDQDLDREVRPGSVHRGPGGEVDALAPLTYLEEVRDRMCRALEDVVQSALGGHMVDATVVCGDTYADDSHF